MTPSFPAGRAGRGMRALILGGAVAACGLATIPAAAQELQHVDARPWRMTASVGVTGGGDRLATAYYWYRDDYTIRAGNLIQGNFGVEFDLNRSLSLSLTIGHHYDGASARNGDLSFTRWPIEALALVRVAPNIRLGGGLRFPLNPRLRADGNAPDVDEDFKVPVGIVAEGEYRFHPNFGLKIRGVTERYKSKNGLPTVKGDHLGIFAAFYF